MIRATNRAPPETIAFAESIGLDKPRLLRARRETGVKVREQIDAIHHACCGMVTRWLSRV